MKLGKVAGLSTLGIALILGTTSVVRAGWGHLTTLNVDTDLKHYALIEDALLKAEIRYCFTTEDTERFPPDRMLKEVRAALRVWTSELEKMGAKPIALTAVDCADPRLDLQVSAKSDPKSTASGYQYGTWLHSSSMSHSYSVVVINTAFQETPAKDIPPVAMSDFAALLQPGESLEAVMNDVSFVHPTTAREFAQNRGLGYLTVFYDSYKTLIHEFGHSFGLCDQYSQDQCDQSHRSPDTPPSVMRDAESFYLMDDDRAGLRSLYERYLWITR